MPEEKNKWGMGGKINAWPEREPANVKNFTNDGGHFTSQHVDINQGVLPPIDQCGGPQVKKTLVIEPTSVVIK